MSDPDPHLPPGADDLAALDSRLRQAVRDHADRFRWLGIALIVVGVLAILFPLVFSIATKLLIGWVFLLAGGLMALTYIGGEIAQSNLGLPSSAIQLFQGMLLFFLLAVDVLTNFRIRLTNKAEVA